MRCYNTEEVPEFSGKMARDFGKEMMQNFVMQIPFSMSSICVAHSFLMWNPVTNKIGIPLFPPDQRFMVGRCRFPVSTAELKVRLVSALEAEL